MTGSRVGGRCCVLDVRTIRVGYGGGDVYECEAILNPTTQDTELPDGTLESTIEFTRLNDWRLVDERETV
jgi:hypothetical protein